MFGYMNVNHSNIHMNVYKNVYLIHLNVKKNIKTNSHKYGLNQHYTAFFSSECLEITVKGCAPIHSILTYCQNHLGYILII